MGRESFLRRVREAAQLGRAHRVRIHDFPPETGYVGVDGDLCARMAKEVDAVGGKAFVVDDREQARRQLAALLRQHDVRSAICWSHEVLDEIELDSLLAHQNVTSHCHKSLAPLDRASQRETMLAADIGISSVDYAIAETGTLVVCSKPGQERVVTLLPPVHAAIVESAQILPDLIDVFDRLDGRITRGLPSNISLITGPSKTGDIELQLTTGVHGPGTWYVIILRHSSAKRGEEP